MLDGAVEGRRRARRRGSWSARGDLLANADARDPGRGALDDDEVCRWLYRRFTQPWGLGLALREKKTENDALSAISRAISTVGAPRKGEAGGSRLGTRRDAYCDVLRIFCLPVWGDARTLRRSFAKREAADGEYFKKNGRWPSGVDVHQVWGWRERMADREAALLLAP